jgi:DNA-directed RNA polymerase alpha subunit
MTADEQRDRRFAAELTAREIQTQLAKFGLAMRGDRASELAGQPISVLGLSLRASHHARRMGIATVSQLCELTEEEVLVWGGFGETTLRDIQQALARVGLRLRWAADFPT